MATERLGAAQRPMVTKTQESGEQPTIGGGAGKIMPAVSSVATVGASTSSGVSASSGVVS